MVRGVVEDFNAGGGSAMLEAAPRAPELRQYRRELVAWDTRELECGNSAGGVLPVVGTCERQRPVVRLQLVAAHGFGDLRKPLGEKLLHLGPRRERGVVVEVDVRHDRDSRTQRGDRPVGLVAFDDEPACARPGIAPELWNVRADEPRGIATEPRKTEGDHPRGRRLAMCARDDDRFAQRDELGKQLRPAPAGDAVRESARDVYLPALRRRRRIVRDLDVDPDKLVEVRRADTIPAAQLRSPRPRERGVAAHAGSADAGDPDAPTL